MYQTQLFKNVCFEKGGGGFKVLHLINVIMEGRKGERLSKDELAHGNVTLVVRAEPKKNE